ncbi:unnamed protein product [Prorocentrum cordatum]|uniref:Uncharacterized protein n=1 Tax=Prorocentrum cordatum TaxID=2364126 RepID=A0ABN9Q892_9DINO|nr:unnamed protein product [Polarella glacialis]
MCPAGLFLQDVLSCVSAASPFVFRPGWRSGARARACACATSLAPLAPRRAAAYAAGSAGVLLDCELQAAVVLVAAGLKRLVSMQTGVSRSAGSCRILQSQGCIEI